MAYTLRLDDKQERTLKKVMGMLPANTANKAFVALLERYEADQNELRALRKKVNELDNDLYELERLYNEKARIEQKITKRLTKDNQGKFAHSSKKVK